MKCQYKHLWKENYTCPEEALPDSKEHFCIFHERCKDKNLEEFHEKINEKITQEDFDFAGYFFPDDISFGNVEFTKEADFISATFTKKADFCSATFTKKVDFYSATFTKEANFESATFSGITYFVDVCFKEEVSFEHTFFSESTQIRLRPECNVSKASFNGSNCERVDFSGSKWSADNKIFEEKKGIRHGDERTINLPALEEIYRRLKQSHQRFGDHDRAGKFYYREMESRRKNQKETKQRINRIWSEILRFTCGYGERPLYTVFLTGAIVSLWALFYLFGGIVHITNGTETIINYDLATRLTPNLTQLFYDFLWALYTSIITFTSLGYGDLHPMGWSRVAASIEVSIGVFMIALFLFVFTRKMVR